MLGALGIYGWGRLAVVMYQYLAWLGDGKRSVCQLGWFLVCFDAYDHDDGNINSALPWFVLWWLSLLQCAGNYLATSENT